MSRVDTLTVFLVVIIVVYSALATGIVAAFAVEEYEGDSKDFDLLDALDWEVSQYENISKPVIFENKVEYTDLDPDREVRWTQLIFEDVLKVDSKGIGFPDNVFWTKLNPEGISDSQNNVLESFIIDNFDTEKNYTYIVFNSGGKLETHALFSIQFYYNVTGDAITYLYDSIEDSIDAGELTVMLGTNLTYIDAFDVGKITSTIIGFGSIYTGIPAEVNFLISGIWWILIILLGVKLIVG